MFRSSATRIPVRPALVATLIATAALVNINAASAADTNADLAKLFRTDAAPFLKNYCVKCHSGKKPKAELTLDKITADVRVTEDRDLWEAILDIVESGDMPPEKQPQPKSTERKKFSEWLKKALGDYDCEKHKHPGTVTIRRLNRAEYNNTIRDLVGIDFQPAKDFPADDVGHGFDNIGAVLTLSPILMERYLEAAEKIVEQAFANPKFHDQLLTSRSGSPENNAREILSTFASRAFRRPAKKDEIDRLIALFKLGQDRGANFQQSLGLALQAVLVSPRFLFRVELDDNPDDAEVIRPLNDYELATRLSYFLWTSMPDDTLYDLAKQGTLHKPDVLLAQVERMLKDPKSQALVKNFAGQWLELRTLEKLTPDPGRYPAFNPALGAAMRKETELFFESVMREDRSVLEFLHADYTFLNEQLARHYGISGVTGEEFRRVKLTDPRRGGVLTQASILTITSNPTRTSPVKRGKWIMTNILGTPPPPPPENVELLAEGEAAELLGTLRERMEQHRAKPECAVCHTRMDVLGFGFENFDGIGAWRTKDGKFPIDPAGVLPDGQKFKGPAELKSMLINVNREQFTRCLSEKLLTYALGRGVEFYDRCAVDEIVKQLAKDEYAFSSLIIAIVRSDPFRLRGSRGDKK